LKTKREIESWPFWPFQPRERLRDREKFGGQSEEVESKVSKLEDRRQIEGEQREEEQQLELELQ
jgi:hypothetical protein